MATIYTTLIIMGEKTFKQVPATLKEQVRNQLIVLEAEHLIIED
ncbi:CD1375 family protein [Bacillus infantis]